MIGRQFQICFWLQREDEQDLGVGRRERAALDEGRLLAEAKGNGARTVRGENVFLLARHICSKLNYSFPASATNPPGRRLWSSRSTSCPSPWRPECSTWMSTSNRSGLLARTVSLSSTPSLGLNPSLRTQTTLSRQSA